MANYEIYADDYQELQKVLYEEFIEEVNWAFAQAFEVPAG